MTLAGSSLTQSGRCPDVAQPAFPQGDFQEDMCLLPLWTCAPPNTDAVACAEHLGQGHLRLMITRLLGEISVSYFGVY